MLKIGQLEFANNFIQAPLAGYSCAPMRVLATRLGQPAYCCTEMISAKDLIKRQNQVYDRYLYKDPEEGLLCYQLSGNCADDLRYASDIVINAGADLIDLNCGCPQPKIRKKQVGSRLLEDPEHLFHLVASLRKHVDLPLTVKIRVDGSSSDNYTKEVADAVASAGADALIVHGRHWTEGYDTHCHYQQVAEIVKQVRIPVIGNGDIADLASLNCMLATGCAGVMLARSSLGQPWLFAQLQQQLCGENFQMPSLSEIGQWYLEHIKGLIALEDEHRACLQARKLGKYYARERINNYGFTQAQAIIKSLACVESVVATYFTE